MTSFFSREECWAFSLTEYGFEKSHIVAHHVRVKRTTLLLITVLRKLSTKLVRCSGKDGVAGIADAIDPAELAGSYPAAV